MTNFSALKINISDFEGTPATYEITINRLVAKHNALVDRMAEEIKFLSDSISVLQSTILENPVEKND